MGVYSVNISAIPSLRCLCNSVSPLFDQLFNFFVRRRRRKTLQTGRRFRPSRNPGPPRKS